MPILNTISIKNASSEYNRTTTVIVFDVIPLPPTVIINNHSNISAVDLVPISTWYHHSPTNHVVRVVWIGVRIDGGDLIESFRLYDCNFLFTTLDHFFNLIHPLGSCFSCHYVHLASTKNVSVCHQSTNNIMTVVNTNTPLSSLFTRRRYCIISTSSLKLIPPALYGLT